MTTSTLLFSPVEADLQLLTDNLRELVGARHPILYAAAEHLFRVKGKRVRPAIVLLISRTTMLNKEITPKHRRLAEITEMIHTASLVHDDIVDESEIRRGVPTVHSLFTNRVAVLAGDFLFAQSSWYLANLDNLEVVKLLSEVIMDLAEGEIQQGLHRFDTNLSIEAYLEKSYYKTASLIANSSKAAAIISGVPPELAQNMYYYGKYLGLAFQIVDDILDFTSATESLGKPSFSDLKNGNLTAPTLYAFEEKPALEKILARGLAQDGDLEEAIQLIKDSLGIKRSQELATQYANMAVEYLQSLPDCDFRQALINLTDYVLSRLY